MTATEADQIALCRDAAERSACVIAGFFRIDPVALFKSTRGSPREAFPRQLLMAGLAMELGFPVAIVGHAIGRDPATVEHACRIVEALRGGLDVPDLIDVLGAAGVDEFLGGEDGVDEFAKHVEPTINEIFAAFVLVAVKGGAYSRELHRQEQERAKR